MSDNSQKPSSSQSATAFDLSKLRDELQCCICLSLFEEPRNLPCGHICCAACIQGLIAVTYQPVFSIKCPKCRENVRVPADGQFPTAFSIKSMVSHFKQAEAAHPNGLKVMAKEHGEKIAQLEKRQKQLESQNGTLAKLVKELVEKTEKLEMNAKLCEEKEQAAEYARLIGMPTVNLKENYEKEKLLILLKHGNGIGPKLYIQENQELADEGLLQSIVDLLATVDKPEKMVGEVTIEPGVYCLFNQPQNAELKLKKRKSNVAIITFNEASDDSQTLSGWYLAEYELVNKDNRFQVLLYYYGEWHFNKFVWKFVYHRLE